MSELTRCQQENESCGYAKLEAENARIKEELLVLKRVALGLQTELAAAQLDAARLDLLEEKAKSHTGVSIDYAKYVEDGRVLEKGFRVMWFHNLGERKPTIREAIDSAMKGEQS